MWTGETPKTCRGRQRGVAGASGGTRLRRQCACTVHPIRIAAARAVRERRESAPSGATLGLMEERRKAKTGVEPAVMRATELIRTLSISSDDAPLVECVKRHDMRAPPGETARSLDDHQGAPPSLPNLDSFFTYTTPCVPMRRDGTAKVCLPPPVPAARHYRAHAKTRGRRVVMPRRTLRHCPPSAAPDRWIPRNSALPRARPACGVRLSRNRQWSPHRLFIRGW
jgi:hypothetical protein